MIRLRWIALVLLDCGGVGMAAPAPVVRADETMQRCHTGLVQPHGWPEWSRQGKLAH